MSDIPGLGLSQGVRDGEFEGDGSSVGDQVLNWCLIFKAIRHRRTSGTLMEEKGSKVSQNIRSQKHGN